MSKIINNIQPTSATDYIARQHDIDMLTTSGSVTGGIVADVKAMAKSLLEPSLQSFALRLGLGARTLGSILTWGNYFNYNNSLPGLTDEETQKVGEYLNDIVGSS